MMAVATWSRQIPMDLFVHPQAAAYITRRIGERFPVVSRTADRFCCASAATAPAALTLWHADGRITGFVATFTQADGPPIGLTINPIVVASPVPAMPRMPEVAGTWTPSPGLSTVFAFVRGFYQVLSDMIPRAPSPDEKR